MSISLKLGSFFSFMNCLRVELFYVLVSFVFSMNQVPTAQLFQDKICIQKFNQTAQFCAGLAEMDDEDDPGYRYKSLVLKESSQFNMYSFLISFCPSIFWSMLLGPWVDRYYYGKKLLLLISGMCMIIESFVLLMQSYWFDIKYQYILLNYIPSGITASFYGSMTAIFAYATVVTPVRLRALRIAILSVTVDMGTPVANYIVGNLIGKTPLFGNGQLHNYSMMFLISNICSIFSFFWVLIMVDERKDKQRFEIHEIRYANIDKSVNELKHGIGDKKQEQQKTHKYIENVHPIKLLFDFDNVKEIYHTLIKRRPNKKHVQLWLCLFSMVIYTIAHWGTRVFQYQFNQRVYNWGPTKQSYVQSISSFITPINMIFSSLILVKVIQMREMSLAIIGCTCYIIQSIILGTMLNETGNYISILFSINGGLTVVGVKSYLSNTMPSDEIGKMFSLMSVFDSLAPLISTTFYTSIFRLTMDYMPGLCYHIAALMLMIPVFAFAWIDLYTRSNIRQRESEEELKEQHNELDQVSKL